MIFTEDNLIPLSYLSQYYYCPRRAGLLMVDRMWKENEHTAEGHVIHNRVHETSRESRADLLIFRGLYLQSLQLGLFGVADSVELYSALDGNSFNGIGGKWKAVPIEYKHGEVREEVEYEVQLCAQAICIEEMTGSIIENGFVYYAGDRRRKEVIFSPHLRELVTKGAAELHEMLKSGTAPRVVRSKKCNECSMMDDCMPRMKKSAGKYLQEMWKAAEKVDT